LSRYSVKPRHSQDKDLPERGCPSQIVGPVLDFCKILIDHAQAAFDMMGADADLADAKYAFQWLKA
jgi:hypothetical protein